MSEVVAGRYVLIDRIGSGGTGEVWRAFDRRTRGYCAAKVIRHPEAATLVRAVFEQGVRLDHPHVVTPYAWAADDEQVLLAMPLIRGGSLAVLLRDHGNLPPRYGAEILRQLLVALHHVHTAGLVHRDVKPANVLLEPTGTAAPHARLADFGLVLTPDRPRVTGTFMVVGTRAYMAPESLKRGDQGVAQDLYAAGLVGTEMIGSTPGPLSSLLTMLTAPDPAYRPHSAGQALRHLDDLLTGWPLHTPAMIPDTDEPVEVFEQIGPLPPGWGATGPASPAAEAETVTLAGVGEGVGAGAGAGAGNGAAGGGVGGGVAGLGQPQNAADSGLGAVPASGAASGLGGGPQGAGNGSVGGWAAGGPQGAANGGIGGVGGASDAAKHGPDTASATTAPVATRSEPIARSDIASSEFRASPTPPGLAADSIEPPTATTAAGPLDHVRSLPMPPAAGPLDQARLLPMPPAAGSLDQARSLPVPSAADPPTPPTSQRHWLLAAALAAALAAVSAIGAIVLLLR